MENAATSKPVTMYRAWAMYDWANSAYNLVITSTIFPAYYSAITEIKKNDLVISDKVIFFGKSFTNSVLYMYSLAAAYLVIAFLSPLLSSIADYKGNKKSFMRMFCYIGSAACCGLYFFKLNTLEWGIICFVLAAIGYCGSLVFYNAYLPEIAEEKDRDRVSALGFSYGYIGSVILQLICFLFVLKPEWFGITDASFPARLSFLLVGVWWFGFSHITFARLPKGNALVEHPEHNILVNGFIELKKVWKQVKHLPVLKTYLGAFFMYSMGVQTVVMAATIFGSKEMKLEDKQLIAVILIIQLVAIAGAVIISRLSGMYGNLKVLLGLVCIWIGGCILAYYIRTAVQFYLLAVLVGIVMGGIQSLSRSTYSKLMPPTKDTASFFSFYDVTEKIAIVLGMFSFGLIEDITGSMRNSILALIAFFAIGGIVLYFALLRERKEKTRLQSL